MEESNMQEITKQDGKTIRAHRVGSITFGCMLVLFGSLFLVHMITPLLTYEMIFSLWPCIFILLGVEILVANRKGQKEFTYDVAAVFLIVLLALFAMGMAVADWCIQHTPTGYFYW